MLESILEYINTVSSETALLSFTLRAFAVVILNLLLRLFYIKFGTANTNRSSLGGNFVLLSITIYLIIYLIKGSIALSLGLVGALSIVRFRSAIKEPEELIYLFFSIAIGLGFGAEQSEAVVIIFGIALLVIYIKSKYNKHKIQNQDSLFLHIVYTGKKDRTELLSALISILEKNCHSAEIKRLDDLTKLSNYTFIINLINQKALEQLRGELLSFAQKNEKMELSIIDNSAPLIS